MRFCVVNAWGWLWCFRTYPEYSFWCALILFWLINFMEHILNQIKFVLWFQTNFKWKICMKLEFSKLGFIERNDEFVTCFCWNKMCLTLPPLSFDDNKVLKCQLDMLTFVQVCRTIVNNYMSIIGYGRTNKSNGIYKRSLCCKVENRIWRQEHLKTIKSFLPEVDIISGSEESQKVEFIRAWRLEAGVS